MKRSWRLTNLELPASDVNSTPLVSVLVNEDWKIVLLSLASLLEDSEIWIEGIDADRSEQMAFLLYVQIRSAELPPVFIYPTIAVMHHEAARIAVGATLIDWLAVTGQADGGVWYQNPGALNDEFYQSVYLAAGTYGLFILGRTAPAAGKVTWKIDGVTITTADDWYAATVGVNVLHYYPLTIVGDGVHELRGKVTGHTGATGYNLTIKKYWIRKN